MKMIDSVMSGKELLIFAVDTTENSHELTFQSCAVYDTDAAVQHCELHKAA